MAYVAEGARAFQRQYVFPLSTSLPANPQIVAGRRHSLVAG